MSDTAVAARPVNTPAVRGLARWLPLAVCAVLEFALIWYASEIRTFEARMSAPLVKLVTGGGQTKTVGDIVFFSLGEPSAQGLRISAGCSVTALLIPFYAAFALFGVLAARKFGRWLLAAVVGTCALLVVNLIRIGIIAFSVHTWGRGAFTVSHWYVGSLFAIIGFTVAMILAVRLLTSQNHAPKHTGDPQDDKQDADKA